MAMKSMNKPIKVEDDTSVYVAYPYEAGSWAVRELDAETKQELACFSLPAALVAALAARAKLEPQLPAGVIHEAVAALEHVMNSVIGRDETHWQYVNIEDAIKFLRALLPSPPSPNEEPKA